MNTSQYAASTRLLKRPEGTIGYDVGGDGPLVVCVAGMGDLRSTYRYLAPSLVAEGFRVATMDLRGHGDSATSFTSYDDPAAASDLIALIEELGGPAVAVGNSMGGAASVIAASQRPDLFNGVVLLDAFVRNPDISWLTTTMFRVLTARPWAAMVWKSYLPKLYAGRKPDDFDSYRTEVVTALRRPGYAAAFSATTKTSHAPAEAAIGKVTIPTLVVMGDLDPDFGDPRAEAQWAADQTGGEVLMVDDAGHYPQSQRPDVVNPAVASFARRVTADA